MSTRHFTRRRGSRAPHPVYPAIESRIDAEIAISDAVARSIGIPSTVVHSGVEDAVAPAAATRSRTVLMAQRLQPEKRTRVGLAAFAASGLANEGWRLQIAGAGPERSLLEADAASFGIADSVDLLGFRDDIAQLYRQAGLFLAPCPVEGLGLSLLEAMATGLPALAADAGGHSEILAGLDPRALFPADDVAAAARSLRALADDDAGRAALGAGGRERQRAEFSIASQLAGTEAVYRAAIAARRRGAAKEDDAAVRCGRSGCPLGSSGPRVEDESSAGPVGRFDDRPRGGVARSVGRRVAPQPAPCLAPVGGDPGLRVLFVEPPADPCTTWRHGVVRRALSDRSQRVSAVGCCASAR